MNKLFLFFLSALVASPCFADKEQEVEAVMFDLRLYDTSFYSRWFIDCNTGVDDDGATKMLTVLERVAKDQSLPSMQVEDETGQSEQSR